MLVEEADSRHFADATVLYKGTDGASVISGRPDGDYYFRIRFADVDQPSWSPPLHVVVAHHSLTKALAFFGVGASVFVATIGLILYGSRRTREGVTRD